MKKVLFNSLACCAVAALVSVMPTSAMADHKHKHDHDHRNGRDYHSRQISTFDYRYRNHNIRDSYYHGYRDGYRNGRTYYIDRSHYDRGYYSHDHDAIKWLGGALIINELIHHHYHKGRVCYTDH